MPFYYFDGLGGETNVVSMVAVPGNDACRKCGVLACKVSVHVHSLMKSSYSAKLSLPSDYLPFQLAVRILNEYLER